MELTPIRNSFRQSARAIPSFSVRKDRSFREFQAASLTTLKHSDRHRPASELHGRLGPDGPSLLSPTAKNGSLLCNVMLYDLT